MQRKNYLLSTTHKTYKNGIAMIMAITVIVIVATLMALALALTSKTTKKTTDMYLYEQAAILSHSAAEYAMLKISQVSPCSLDRLDFRYNNTYDVNVTMQYVYFAGSACDGNATADGTNYAPTTTLGSDGTVIMDVAVSSDASSEPIRYFRRTIQKL